MRVLLLAGTGEARALAAALAQEPGIEAEASLAGVTRQPAELALPTRHGGFGGDEGFLRYLDEAGTGAVIDATHPFAARISERTARLCAARGVPYCQVLRPPWRPEPGDDWHEIAREEDAAALIPRGARVFLATGRQTLERFANLEGRELICRQIDAPEGPFPFPNGRFLQGRPPFSVEDEVALFALLGIDWLVVKNAGGAGARTKLTAARQLSIPVAMIRRPEMPKAERVETVAAALDWLRGLTG